MTVHALAPASTANLGPAFDCAAAALELWNELVVEESDGGGVEIEGEGAAELPRDAAISRSGRSRSSRRPSGYRFRFVNRIPLERGLGSSAAAIALGLVAGSAVAGSTPIPASCCRTACASRATRTTSRPRCSVASASRGGTAATCVPRGSPTTCRSRRGRRARDANEHRRVAQRSPRHGHACRRRRERGSPRCSEPRSPPVTRSSSRAPSTTGCTSNTVPATLRCSARSARARPTARSA